MSSLIKYSLEIHFICFFLPFFDVTATKYKYTYVACILFLLDSTALDY